MAEGRRETWKSEEGIRFSGPCCFVRGPGRLPCVKYLNRLRPRPRGQQTQSQDQTTEGTAKGRKNRCACDDHKRVISDSKTTEADMLRAAVLAAVALPGALSFQACGIRTFTPPLPGGGSSSSSFAMRPLGRGACKLSMGTRFTEEDLSRRAGAATGSDEAVKGSPFKLIKALKKPKGTICVAAAVKRKDPVDGELCKLPNDGFVIEELSQGFNNAKVAALAVWTDAEKYGTDIEELALIAKAQAKFKGNFPGPVPVLACDVFSTKAAISDAARASASGVLLSQALLKDKLGELIAHAKECGMDSVVLCETAEEMDAATAAGAEIVAVDSKTIGIDAAVEVRAAYTGSAICVAFGGVKDLPDAWKFRTGGFSCVVVGSELMTCAFGKVGEIRQVGGKEGMGASVVSGNNFRKNDVNTYVKAMTSKASSLYGPTSVNAFREKGAKSKRHYEV